MSRVFFMFLLLELAYIKSYAQFFTIMPDSGQSTILADETAYGDSVNIPLVLHLDTIRTEIDSLMMAKREENLFPSSKGLPISIEKRVSDCYMGVGRITVLSYPRLPVDICEEASPHSIVCRHCCSCF